ncbi:MAG: hypothetical protein H6751_01520 [Candidatus Omnitrophica bacterium]|nr:hypothetical protein [Candidatus Omnitrophota bacterium]
MWNRTDDGKHDVTTNARLHPVYLQARPCWFIRNDRNRDGVRLNLAAFDSHERIRRVVDMPDRRLSVIRLCLQGKADSVNPNENSSKRR